MAFERNKKRDKKKKLGKACAFIDIVTFTIITFYSSFFVYSPFVDIYINNRNRISFGKNAGMIYLQVGWTITAIIIFNIYRGGLFEDKPEKFQLKRTSFWLFAISAIMLFFSFVISPYIENVTLDSINDDHKLILMNKLYIQYFLFCIYSLIRWLGHFDYYQYYYFEKGKKYNLTFFYYFPFIVAGIAFFSYSIIKN